MSLIGKIQELLNIWFPNKEQDKINFKQWYGEEFIYKNGVIHRKLNLSFSDITSYYLEDNSNPFPHNCTHTVTYDSGTGYSRIRINEGNANNTVSRYYLPIPLNIFSNNMEISVDFYTTGFSNDDFGIRICDKNALDTNNQYISYGAWIITGQGRLAYGYGGLETNNTKYYDYYFSTNKLKNDMNMNYTFRLTNNKVYYSLKNLDNNSIIYENEYTRTDTYQFSGLYYLYIGGGKFSTGSEDKSVYLKNLKIKEII